MCEGAPQDLTDFGLRDVHCLQPYAVLACSWPCPVERLVPLGSHRVSAPWGGTLSTTKDVHSDVSVDARQKGGEPAEACNTTS